MPSQALKPQDERKGGSGDGGGGGKPRGREGRRERVRARTTVSVVLSSCGEIHREEIYHVCGRPPARARPRCRGEATLPAVARGRSSSPPRYVMTMMTIIIISDELFLRKRADLSPNEMAEDSCRSVGLHVLHHVSGSTIELHSLIKTTRKTPFHLIGTGDWKGNIHLKYRRE